MKNFYTKTLITVFAFLLSINTYAQDSLEGVVDSTVTNNISITELSISFSNVELKVSEIKRDFSKIENVDTLSYKIYQIIDPISRNDAAFSHVKLEKLKTRRLENDLVYWKSQLEKVEKQRDEISSYINKLDQKIDVLNKQILDVNKNYSSISTDNVSSVITESKNKILKNIKSLKIDYSENRNKGLIVLSRCSDVADEVMRSIDRLEKTLVARQTDFFSSKLEPFYEIDYLEISNWKVKGTIKSLLNVEFPILLEYLASNVSMLVFTFLLFLILSYLFYYLKNHHKEKGIGDLSAYKRYYVVLLEKPITLAFIISVFIVFAASENVPVLLEDLLRLILVIPLVFLLKQLVDKKYYLLIYLFGISVILSIVYVFLPAEKIPSRILLVLISVTEIFALIWSRELVGGLLVFARHKFIEKVFKNIIYLHIITSFIGLIVGVFGLGHLSELLVKIVYGNIYVFLLLGIVLVVINGSTAMFIESKYAERINSIRENKIALIKSLTNIINFIFIIILFISMLTIIGVDYVFSEAFTEFMSKQRSFVGVPFSVGGIITFILVIYFSIAISKVVRSLLEDDILVKLDMEQGLSHTISTMARYAIITIGVLFAFKSGGLALSEFTIVLSAFGVGIGFGLQNIFNNLVSGFILLFERPIKIGDTVEVGTLIGKVRKIGIRSSNVRTFDGAEIIVPNGNLISNEVINWTLSDKTRRIELIVGVTYSADPDQVKRILLDVISKHDGIVNNPSPNVFFYNFGESSIDFRMLFWTNKFDEWINIKSDIMFAVFAELGKAGIEIPFPQRDIHIKSIDPSVELKSSSVINPNVSTEAKGEISTEKKADSKKKD